MPVASCWASPRAGTGPEGIVGVRGSRKRIYGAEFREGAVRIVTETGKPIPEVAQELGAHLGTLQN